MGPSSLQKVNDLVKTLAKNEVNSTKFYEDRVIISFGSWHHTDLQYQISQEQLRDILSKLLLLNRPKGKQLLTNLKNLYNELCYFEISQL
jgi:uncharacterized protein YifN (PemK superfamily)